ncbi:hypothetical protein ACH4U6_34910 [Streptomyces netropsis]|uniref:hypothetical protein n=1 Tax=Streptomyces netropsis TaxID=55404 RepID=UPI0037A000CF
MTTPLPRPADAAPPMAEPEELLVARARRQAILLAAALVREPLNRKVHQDLRAFVERDSEPALRAWESLVARHPDELRERIRVVLGCTAVGRAS